MQILGRDIIMITGLTLTGFFFKRKNGEKIITLHNVGIILFVLSMLCIFSLTGVSPISGFHTDIRLTDISLIPFDGIREIASGGLDFYSLTNILGNILLFVPIGFFLPLLWKNFQSLGKTLLVGLSVSLLIECSQLFLARGTDIDDLILNTCGALIGYICFIVFRKLFPTFSKKCSYEIFCVHSARTPYLCMLTPYVLTVFLGFIDRAIFLA